jgi:energy-coupling factor transporter ATP-binding protein EcfA2
MTGGVVEKLKSTESNTVTGEAFYNREVERRLIREKIENGTHLLLTGQRRMGKSSLAREIGRALEDEKGDEWNYIFVDIQSCLSGAELVARLAEVVYQHSGFKNKIKSWLASVLKQTEKVEQISVSDISIKLTNNLNAGNWQLKGRELLQEIESSEKRTYLVFDEFPDVVNKVHANEGVKGVDTLLDWLRPEIQASVPNQKISILLSGSIGLEPVLQRLSLSNKINNLAIYRLKPWKRTIAKNCLLALVNYREITVDEAAIDYLLDELGVYIPFHIQRTWASLYTYCQEEEKHRVTIEDAQYVFKHIILKSESDSMICHYEERLEETLGEQYFLIAIKLLDKMCTGEPLNVGAASEFKKENTADIDVHYILKVLTHDGDLDEEDDDAWVFNDCLLRKWWQKRKNLR